MFLEEDEEKRKNRRRIGGRGGEKVSC